MATTEKQRLSPVLMIPENWNEEEGAESTQLLSTFANSNTAECFKLGIPLSGVNPEVHEKILPFNKLAILQTHNVAEIMTNEPVNEPANQPDLSGQPANKPDIEPDNQSSSQQANHQVNYQANQMAKDEANYPVNHQDNPKDPQIWYPFTEKQGRILLYLIQAGGITKREQIAKETGINIATIKYTLRIFVRGGYISNIKLYTKHSYRGFSYIVNPLMCNEFAERLTGKPLDYPANHPAGYPVNKPACRQSQYSAKHPAKPALFSSSSSKEEKLTTVENHDLLKDPELLYWKEHGVNNRKVLQWAEEFEMELEQVISSLKYCRYEMVVLNYEEVKQIRKPSDWFYRVVQRSGLYPKPAGYKSIAELRVEQMEQDAMEAKALRERQQRAEKLLEFQRIMSDPDSLEFKDILSKASEFSRDAGGTILAMELESIYMGTNVESVEALALK